MAAHRYWRTVGLESLSGGLIELTEFWLLAGTVRVDVGATLAGTAPLVGALVSLQDDDLGTGVVLPRGAVLAWDFGPSGADVSDIRLGSAGDAAKFPLLCGLQYSDDGVTWASGNLFAGILWPGARAKTVSEQLGNLFKANVFSSGSSGAPDAVVSPYTSITLFDNNGVFVSPKAAGVRQFEVSRTAITGGGIGIYVGVAGRAAIDAVRPATASVLQYAPQITYGQNGFKYVNTSSSVAYGASWTVGDVIGCVVDFASAQVTFYKNGVSQGVAGTFLFSGGECFPYVQAAGSSGRANAAVCSVRTRGFAYPVAGTEPWEDRTAIATGAVQGRNALEAARVVASAGAMPPASMRPLPATMNVRGDFAQGMLGRGVGRVRGFTLDYVNPLNKPYSCRVRLVRESDGLQIREVWSGADGSYDFQFVDELQSYTVVAYYLAHGKRAVVTDGLTLANGKVELMP